MKPLILLLSLVLAACGPAEAPSQIAKPQREALDKAKAVDDIVQKQALDQKQAADEAAK